MRNRILWVLIVMSLPLVAFAESGVVRDGSGNLVESWSKKGNRIEIRDKDNNLIKELNPRGDRIEIRDCDNNLVGEMRRDRD